MTPTDRHRRLKSSDGAKKQNHQDVMLITRHINSIFESHPRATGP